MKKFWIILVLNFFCFALVAGPFGLEMGWTEKECETAGAELNLVQSDKSISGYKAIPPKKHASFESYYLFIHDAHGLYQISAISPKIQTSSNGSQLLSEFKRIRDQISKTYGDPADIDYLDKGSIWTEPGDWMMGLVMKERHLSSFWVPDSPSTGNIEMIWLEAQAESSHTGSLELHYFSSATSEIENEKESEESSVF